MADIRRITPRGGDFPICPQARNLYIRRCPNAETQGDVIGTTIRKPRNIVICCDGTGNEFGGANSNVVKLYTALEIDAAQVAYYHPGVRHHG